jgi:nicotinamide-nucleotide amidase
VTGGLGPTLDDVTRHAVARAAGVPLVSSAAALQGIRSWFERAGRGMPAANDRQALLPEGAELLPNERGTAPGFELALGASRILALPGPPAEMRAMLEAAVLPRLARLPAAGEVCLQHSLQLFDLSESLFADRVGSWMARDSNPLMGVTAKEGVLSVRIVARSARAADAEVLLAARVAEMRARFQEHLFSEEGRDLATVLGETLLAAGLRVALAESCTGGMVAARLTRVAGISRVFRRGWVSYSDEAKQEELGVAQALLEEHGAVSAEAARAMALGAAGRAGARLALSVTGNAGPEGGTERAPVGLVWFGTCVDGEAAAVSRRWPDAGRERIREWATNFALLTLLKAARSL